MPGVRRLIRIAFNALAVISLLLAILVAGLWVRSYGRVDFFHYNRNSPTIANVQGVGGFSTYGWLVVAVFDWPQGQNPRKLGFGGRVQVLDPKDPATAKYAEDWKYGYFSAGAGHGQLTFRWWNVFILTGILPAAWGVMRYCRHRIVKAGRCLTCGYDLRATPERCPECGAMPKAASV
jgi:hypothetical protein